MTEAEANARPAPGRAARLKKRLAYLKRRARPRVTVRSAGWDTVELSRLRTAGRRRYRLDDPGTRCAISTGTLVVALPDASVLARLTMSGLLSGRVRRLHVRLAMAPGWLVAGARAPRVAAGTAEFSWRRDGDGVEIVLAWSKPYEVDRALGDALAAVLRARPWDQLGGPVFVLDRAAWLGGASSWPQGHIGQRLEPPEVDALGRPLGPFLPSPAPTAAAGWPLVTAVANPWGRVLTGTATPYRLITEPGRLVLRDATGAAKLALDRADSPERAVLAAALPKYAVISIDEPVAGDRFTRHALRVLAACGVVFATASPAVRAQLEALGVLVVTEPGEVSDLRGYALSVESTRRLTILGDPALRRTALTGDGTLPLPAVTAVVSSRRPDDVDACLGYLVTQTYPEFEVVLGTHGYQLGRDVVDRWSAALPVPLRVVPVPAEQTLGTALGRLSRMADGELITKVDDDDHYGPHHVTDLVLSLHTSGADLVAKGARFVHLPELGKTIDRIWAAPEVFNVTVAGGTMLIARSTLQQVGGWSASSRHVDSDLISRVRAGGGLTYRTHALEYVYVRRAAGHTWTTKIDDLVDQGGRAYDDLPAEIVRPDPAV